MKDWFTVERIDEVTYIISEYGHWEKTHCYLLIGQESALLIDTGLGVSDISRVVENITKMPVTAVGTHIHWDHVGGHHHFKAFYAHQAELAWLQGDFPLTNDAISKILQDRCILPDDFCPESYRMFQGTPSRILSDGDWIDLGGREVQALHTPGHSPGHLCFWEPERGYLYTGDLVYEGLLLADFPSTNPDQYLNSLEKLSSLSARRLFPGHHNLNIAPGLLIQMRDAFRVLKATGKLHHGSGTHDFLSWSVRL